MNYQGDRVVTIRIKNLSGLLVSILALVLLIPSLAFAEEGSNQPSRFQFELFPGQTTDDALVIVNESEFPETISVTTVDRGSSSGAFSSEIVEVMSGGFSSWIRYLDPTLPEDPSEIKEALVGIPSPRVWELCTALADGALEKQEREARVVKALNRNLTPSEIQYLSDVSLWCQGTPSSEAVLGPGETLRIPFLLHIPFELEPREYRAAMRVDYSDGRTLTAALLQETVPGAPLGKLAIDTVMVDESESGNYRIRVSVVNQGGRTVRDQISVFVESSFPSKSSLVMRRDIELAVGGFGSEEFIWKKPFFGSLEIRASVGDDTIGKEVFSTFVVPVVPLGIILGILILFTIFVFRHYRWKRIWRNSVSHSWSPVVCEDAVTSSTLSRVYGIPESVIAEINGIPVGSQFHAGDQLLLPPSHLLVSGKKVKKQTGQVPNPKRESQTKRASRSIKKI